MHSSSPELANLEVLPREWYEASAEVVAPKLLGHWLLRRTTEGICGGLIVETEAYLQNDPACHGYRGETKRNRALFGPPGFAYVYLIYGMHFCFNTVCRPAGCGEAVLVRAIEASFGEAWMRNARGGIPHAHRLTSGPARLCEALRIDRKFDAVDLCDPRAELFVASNPSREKVLLDRGPIRTTTRVGITKAAELPLRFYLENSRFVSRRAAGLSQKNQSKRTR